MCYTVYAISELFGTACIVCGAGCMHLSGVRLSV